jgi:hypothetical protein
MKCAVQARTWGGTLLIFLAVAFTAGCGVSPEGVAEEFVTRFAERSFEDLDKYVAADQRAEFRDFLAEYQAGLAAPENPGQAMLSAMVLDVDDVDTKLVSEDKTSARVRLDLDLDIKGPARGEPFLDTPNQAIQIEEISAEGSLDMLLVKEKGRWMVDVMATSELWDQAMAKW